MKTVAGSKLYNVASGTPEYSEVEAFFKTCSNDKLGTVKKIERVQSPHMWQRYIDELGSNKVKEEEKKAGDAVEQRLCYCWKWLAKQQILDNGFDEIVDKHSTDFWKSSAEGQNKVNVFTTELDWASDNLFDFPSEGSN